VTSPRVLAYCDFRNLPRLPLRGSPSSSSVAPGIWFIAIFRSMHHDRKCLEVSSGPLSIRSACGQPMSTLTRASDRDAEIGGTASHMGRMGARRHRLCGDAPVLTQVPPYNLCSTMASFCPAAAKRCARNGRACPVPMMIASKRVVRLSTHEAEGPARWHPAPASVRVMCSAYHCGHSGSGLPSSFS
jgi:hypothetical protein